MTLLKDARRTIRLLEAERQRKKVAEETSAPVTDEPAVIALDDDDHVKQREEKLARAAQVPAAPDDDRLFSLRCVARQRWLRLCATSTWATSLY